MRYEIQYVFHMNYIILFIKFQQLFQKYPMVNLIKTMSVRYSRQSQDYSIKKKKSYTEVQD